MNGKQMTTDQVKRLLRLGWSNHMSCFDNFTEEEEADLLEWCEMEEHGAWDEGDYRWRQKAQRD